LPLLMPDRSTVHLASACIHLPPCRLAAAQFPIRPAWRKVCARGAGKQQKRQSHSASTG